MADAVTPNDGFTKPTPGKDIDTWGTILNENWDLVDAMHAADGTGTAKGRAVGSGQTLKIKTGATFSCDATAVQFFDSTDTTKIAAIDVSNVTTGTTRTLSVPDEDGIIATRSYVKGFMPTGTVLHGPWTICPQGFVWNDNTTIGSSNSSATQRANNDTKDLFKLLWAVDSCFVSDGGRGDSADDDWAADKCITTLDMRGRTIVTLDNNGAGTSANVLSSFTTVGGHGGNATVSTSVTGTCSVSVSGSVSVSSISVFGTGSFTTGGASTWSSVGSLTGGSTNSWTTPGHTHSGSVSITSTGSGTGTFSGTGTGTTSGTSSTFSVVQPSIGLPSIMAL